MNQKVKPEIMGPTLMNSVGLLCSLIAERSKRLLHI